MIRHRKHDSYTPQWYIGERAEPKMTETRSYRVPDMHCGHCKRAVETEINRVAGVESVDVDLDSKLVTVRGHGVSDEALRDAIGEAGYEAR